MIRQEKLEFWIKNNFNVLIKGKHGIGKSTIIIDAWNKNKLNWRYFSAATMDPWVDFIGVPKVDSDEKGEFLKLILPKDFRDDTIEAIFMDEFNRSHHKIQNAVMELLQFKSINGRKFKNLRMIWAAVNPDEEYNVEPIDPAILDRFQVQIELLTEPSLEYFSNKFGSKLAKNAITWWNNLSDEIKKLISPRRLEYALQMFSLEGGDLRDVLPVESNISQLITQLNHGCPAELIQEFFTKNDLIGATEFLKNENNYFNSINIILENKTDDWTSFWLQTLQKEKLISKIITNDRILKFVLDRKNLEPFKSALENIVKANSNHNIIRKILNYKGLASLKKNINPTPPYWEKEVNPEWSDILTSINMDKSKDTYNKILKFAILRNNTPKIMTTKLALFTLKTIYSIIKTFQAKTIKALTDLFGVINHCIIIIYNECKSWENTLNQLYQESPLFSKLIRNGFGDKLWTL